MTSKSAQNIKTTGNPTGRKTKPAASKLSFLEWPVPQPPATPPLSKRNGGRPNRKKNTEGSYVQEPVSRMDLCHIVPVRQKPLGAYMNLESAFPKLGSGGGVCGSANVKPGISYAAAVENLIPSKQVLNVKTAEPPRVKKKAPKAANRKATVDPKFMIFDVEEPKPHLVILYDKKMPTVDSKIYTSNPEHVKEMQKNPKKEHKKPPHKPHDNPQNGAQNESRIDPPNELKNVWSESSSTETNLSDNDLESEDTLIYNLVPFIKTKSPEFTDSESYLRYHLHRLQQILAIQCADPYWNEMPRTQKPGYCVLFTNQLTEKQFEWPTVEGQTKGM